MRFIIADPGLSENVGHHPNACRFLVEGAKARGIPVQVFGFHDIDPAVRAATGAIPHFASHTYLGDDGTPFCGWLNAFFLTKDATRMDFQRLPGIGRDDVVLVHAARAAQLLAAIEWAARLPEADCPVIVVEMGGSVGVRFNQNPAGGEEAVAPNPSVNSQPLLCRYAAQYLSIVGNRPLHVITYNSMVSEGYTKLMGQTVGVLPFPTPALGKPRNRAGKRPITIASMGHQQVGKGYHLLPDIVAGILEAYTDVRFQIHNSDPDYRYSVGTPVALMIQAQARLRDLAARDSRVTLIDRDVEYSEWVGLIESADVMLCPYDQRRYSVQHSGLTSAAIASGIPVVVPARSTLSGWIDDYGDIGTTFDVYEFWSVDSALRRLLDDFDGYANRAFAAAGDWASTQGVEGFFNDIQKLHATRPAVPRTPLYGGVNAEALAGSATIFTPSSLVVTRENDDGPTAETLKATGDSLLRQGRASDAAASYEAAIVLRPDYAEAHCNLGIALSEAGDAGRAEASLRRALELAPDRVRILTNLGALLSRQGRVDEAAVLLRRARDIDPANGWIKNNLAAALTKQRQWTEAVALLREAVKELPGESTIWFNLGNACEGAEDFVAALEAYRKTVEIRPDYQGAAGKIAALSARAG